MHQKRKRKKRNVDLSLSSICLFGFIRQGLVLSVFVFYSYARLPTMASGPTANRPLTKTFCASCGKGFTPRDAMQIYQENYYHPACFCCSNCGNSLAGKPFYPKPNNQFQCESCNHSLAPMYVGCN